MKNETTQEENNNGIKTGRKLLKTIFFSEITDTLSNNDLPIDFVKLPSINQIQLLIGDHYFYFNENIGNILDTKIMKYLKNIVHIRYHYILNSEK